MLIFAEDNEFFVFLYNYENWSTSLAGWEFTTEKPSIPPQLALVTSAVSLQVDWEEFTQELMSVYPDIVNAI